ncbi:UNVERIFIED_CONTAM: hypothetical protein K2H54_031611 [Gekko kuhli]
MSKGKETTIPVTSGETVPVTMEATTTLLKEEVDEQFPLLFGGATAKVTTQLKRLTWGRFHAGTQETWTLTPGPQQESQYDLTGGLGCLPEDTGADASRQDIDTDSFVETWLELLEHDGMMVELHPGIRETVLCSVHPISLLASMREAADAESHLRTIWIDNATTLGKGILTTLKPKTPSRQKEGGSEKKRVDTPARKPLAHPKTQQALQMSTPQEDLKTSDEGEDKPVGKGQDQL